MSRDERLLVPCAKSPASTSATESPRPAASRAAAAPVIPPPITSTSHVSPPRRRQCAARAEAEKGAKPVTGAVSGGSKECSERGDVLEAQRAQQRREGDVGVAQHEDALE